MSILGLVTNEGFKKSAEAEYNKGWKIHPTSFAVSEVKQVLNNDRSYEDMNPHWYSAPITSYEILDGNTICIYLTLPPNASSIQREVAEIYLMAEDKSGDDFLLALAQPEGELVFSPGGSLTLRMLLTVANIQIGQVYEFKYTQAQEIEQHNKNKDSHPWLLTLLKKHGISIFASEQIFLGQDIDFYPIFDYSQVSYGDLVYKKEGKYRKAVGSLSYRTPLGLVLEAPKDSKLIKGADSSFVVVYSGLVDLPGLETTAGQRIFADTSIGRVTSDVREISVGVGIDKTLFYKDLSIVGKNNVEGHNTAVTSHPYIWKVLGQHGISPDIEGSLSFGANVDIYPTFFDDDIQEGTVVFYNQGQYYKALGSSFVETAPFGVVTFKVAPEGLSDIKLETTQVVYKGLVSLPYLQTKLGEPLYLDPKTGFVSSEESKYLIGVGLEGNYFLMGSSPDLSSKRVLEHDVNLEAHKEIRGVLKGVKEGLFNSNLGVNLDYNPNLNYRNPNLGDLVVRNLDGSYSVLTEHKTQGVVGLVVESKNKELNKFNVIFSGLVEFDTSQFGLNLGDFLYVNSKEHKLTKLKKEKPFAKVIDSKTIYLIQSLDQENNNFISDNYPIFGYPDPKEGDLVFLSGFSYFKVSEKSSKIPFGVVTGDYSNFKVVYFGEAQFKNVSIIPEQPIYADFLKGCIKKEGSSDEVSLGYGVSGNRIFLKPLNILHQEQTFKKDLTETTNLLTNLSNELTQLKKLENSIETLNTSIGDINTKVIKVAKIENDIQLINEKIILITKNLEQGLPIANSQSIGGVIVGDGLKSDSNGKLSFLNNFYTNDVNFYISATGDDNNSGLAPESAKKTLSSFKDWLNTSNFNNSKVTLNLSGDFEGSLEVKGLFTCSEINIKGKAKITSYDSSTIYIQSVLSVINISDLTLNVLDSSTKKDSTKYSCVQIVDSDKVTFDGIIKIKGGEYGVYVSNSQLIQNKTNKLHITNSSSSCIAEDRKAYIEFLGEVKPIGTSKFFIFLDISTIANFKPGAFIDGSLFEGKKCLLYTNALLNTYSQSESFLPGDISEIKTGARIA